MKLGWLVILPSARTVCTPFDMLYVVGFCRFKNRLHSANMTLVNLAIFRKRSER